MTTTLMRAAAGTLLAAASLTLIPLGGCVVGGCSFVAQSPPLKEKAATVSAPHEAAKGLEVHARNGSVLIKPSSGGDVSVTATLRMLSDERLADTTIAANRQADGTLLIEARPPGGKWESSEGCSFEIALPDASGVKAISDNGRIELQGMSGEATLTTSNGAVTSRDHRGPVHASTSNGSVKVEAAHGPVEARSSNGAITVTLADDSPGPVAAKTSNGSIEIHLGAAYKGTLDVSNSNGSVKCPEGTGIQVRRSGKHAATVTVGDGGPTSEVRTSNGAITVVR